MLAGQRPVDTCWIFVPRCRHGLGLLKTKPTLGSLQPSWNLLDLKKQYTCSINERILQVQTDNWDAARILFFYRDNKCMHLFRKNCRTGNSNGGCLCYPSNKNQVPENSFRNKWFSFISTSTLDDGWKQIQVHTKRSLTTIPTCGRQGSTTTNTKLTYNLFTPGPSVCPVQNLAED